MISALIGSSSPDTGKVVFPLTAIAAKSGSIIYDLTFNVTLPQNTIVQSVTLVVRDKITNLSNNEISAVSVEVLCDAQDINVRTPANCDIINIGPGFNPQIDDNVVTTYGGRDWQDNKFKLINVPTTISIKATDYSDISGFIWNIDSIYLDIEFSNMVVVPMLPIIQTGRTAGLILYHELDGIISPLLDIKQVSAIPTFFDRNVHPKTLDITQGINKQYDDLALGPISASMVSSDPYDVNQWQATGNMMDLYISQSIINNELIRVINNEPTWINISTFQSNGGSFSSPKLYIDQPFRFMTLPQGAVVTGLMIQAYRRCTQSSVDIRETLFQLNDNDTLIGSNRPNMLSWKNTTQTIVYGGPTDTWGLTDRQILDHNLWLQRLGLVIQVAAASRSTSAQVHITYLDFTLFYNLSGYSSKPETLTIAQQIITPLKPSNTGSIDSVTLDIEQTLIIPSV